MQSSERDTVLSMVKFNTLTSQLPACITYLPQEYTIYHQPAKRPRFPLNVISQGVWLHSHLSPGYQDVATLMGARGNFFCAFVSIIEKNALA
jgi:hypothetical protein